MAIKKNNLTPGMGHNLQYDPMKAKANKPKGQTLKATPVKAKTGPSSVKMPTKPVAKKKVR
jgi:hypothetical protein